MKIDKTKIDLLLKLNDEQLWSAICLAASKTGVNVKDISKPADMSKIRATLSGLTDDDLSRVGEMLKKR